MRDSVRWRAGTGGNRLERVRTPRGLQPISTQFFPGVAHEPRHQVRLLEGPWQGPCHPQPEFVLIRLRPRRHCRHAQDSRLLPWPRPQWHKDLLGDARVSHREPSLPTKEDWVLCRVFHKKKDDTEYAMDGEQAIVGGMARSATAVCRSNYVSSSVCHDLVQYHHSPTASSPSLGAGGHHYQLTSSDHHHPHNAAGVSISDVDAFIVMPQLLSYDNILDFSQQPQGGGSATASLRDGARDHCGGALMDQGLKVQEEHYNYNSLM